MISVPLDPKKLLGFKLNAQARAEPSAVIAGKVGTKNTVRRDGVLLGAKVGEKLGGKVIRPATRG